MANLKNKKARKSDNEIENSVMNPAALKVLLMRNELSEQMMAMMTETVISPEGVGAATCALAMVWATLKDVACSQGVDVVSLFENEVSYYEGVIRE